MDVSLMGSWKDLNKGRVDENFGAQSQENLSSDFSSITSELCEPRQVV